MYPCSPAKGEGMDIVSHIEIGGCQFLYELCFFLTVSFYKEFIYLFKIFYPMFVIA